MRCERLLEGLGLPIHLVDEYETSREARGLYFAEHPPRGWRRLVPLGLQLPERPIDDYAAILIARRFLARGARLDHQAGSPATAFLHGINFADTSGSGGFLRRVVGIVAAAALGASVFAVASAAELTATSGHPDLASH